VSVVLSGSARSPVWRARSLARATSSPSPIGVSATDGSMACSSRVGCVRTLRLGRPNVGSNGSCLKRSASRQAEMAYLLILLPVLTGLLLLWVLRNDRRQEFVQQRLRAFTHRGETINPTLHRLEQAGTSALIPQNLRLR